MGSTGGAAFRLWGRSAYMLICPVMLTRCWASAPNSPVALRSKPCNSSSRPPMLYIWPSSDRATLLNGVRRTVPLVIP